jgi:hypothetical protein
VPHPRATHSLWRASWIAPAAIIFLTFAAYSPLLTAGFIEWDDPHNVSANPDLNPPTWRAVLRYWRAPFEGLYVPLTYTAWAGVARVSQLVHGGGTALDPTLYHLANLVCHAISSLLVYAILRSVFEVRLPAALGAALFAIHPIQVEAVGWISGLKDILGGLFGFLAIWFYIRRPESCRQYLFATLAFIAAMLCKPAAVGVPLVAGAIAWIMLRRPVPVILRSLVPWLILASPVIVITRIAQPASEAAGLFAWYRRPLVTGDALAFYLGKLVWPVSFALDYGRTLRSFTWIVPVSLAIVLFVARRRAPALLAAGLVSLAALLPVLGLVPFDFQIYSTVADHYAYAAMLGPAIAAAWAVQRWRFAATLALPVLACLATFTFRQTLRWHDTRSLLNHTLAINPRSWMAHINLSADALLRDDPGPALVHARAALRLRPGDSDIHVNLGRALGLQGDFVGAEIEFRRAIELNSASAAAHANLGLALEAQGRTGEAITEYCRALEIDPKHQSAARALSAAMCRSNPSPPR